MKIYFSVLIISLILGTSFRSYGFELHGKSLLNPLCAEIEYETVKDCSNSTDKDEVLGCTFRRMAVPCKTLRQPTCSIEVNELSNNVYEITIVGERGYFNFELNKNYMSSKDFRVQKTTHSNLLYKTIVDVYIKTLGSLDKPIEIRALEYEKNRLTGKIQESDKVFCVFEDNLQI